MSLSLAETWVRSVIRSHNATAEVLQLLHRAEATSAVASIIIGSQLSHSGKCFLARWDGTELLVTELTLAEQRDWAIAPGVLYQDLKSMDMPLPTRTPEALLSLQVEHVDAAAQYDGLTELSGVCAVEPVAVPGDGFPIVRSCAEYFRPKSVKTRSAFWHCDESLLSGVTKLHFRFPPLFSEHGPQAYHGIVAVYLQLFTADNWTTAAGGRAISNVAQTIIQLK